MGKVPIQVKKNLLRVGPWIGYTLAHVNILFRDDFFFPIKELSFLNDMVLFQAFLKEFHSYGISFEVAKLKGGKKISDYNFWVIL